MEKVCISTDDGRVCVITEEECYIENDNVIEYTYWNPETLLFEKVKRGKEKVI